MDGLQQGLAEKQHALDLFEDHRAAYLERARWWAVHLANMHGQVSTDELWEMCPVPEEFDPRVLGAVFRGKKWERVGQKLSRRPVCHGRPVTIWRLRER